ncbi:MAG: large conductance mechanosensitive channel protein MscL [Saprospiraceae bacterium]|jgi:large conductance mechanosensitive channel|nr:large conductance mechanosensitive channel protein MscL [Saprospiraceae bacterium]MBK8670847.1 large conductance mechanosensitive channel protein MscL [Saprospiraceae bacterium]
MLKEFKEFALKGSLIDVAVGLVMATAFGAITAAFVDGIFMPIVGQIFQIGDLSAAKIVLSPAELDAAGAVTKPESAIMYGKFIGAILNFIIVAFVMFLVIKALNATKKAEAPAPPAGPTQEELLSQIRDLLKK